MATPKPPPGFDFVDIPPPPPGFEPVEGGPSSEVAQEAAFRRKTGAGGMGMRVTDNVTFGAAIPISAGLEAAGKTAYKALSGQPTDFVGDYKFSRDVQDEILKQSRDEGGVGGHIGELALSVPFFGGKQTVGTAVEAAAPVARSYLAQLWDAAKAGAAYSGIYGFNSARGGLGEHVENTATHAAVGAALSPLLKLGIDATSAAARVPGNALRWATSRTPEDVASAAANKADFAESGVREFGPAITPSGTQRRTAEGLAGSVFGAPLRREAQGAIDDATRAVQYAVRDPIGNQPVNDAAAEVQNVLRRNLTQRSIPSDRIQNMTPEELARITGPIDEHGFSPVPPQVSPIAPRPVTPVMPEPVNPSSVKFDPVQPRPVERPTPQPKYPERDALPPNPELSAARVAAEHEFVLDRKAAMEARAKLEQVAKNRNLTLDDVDRLKNQYAGNDQSALRAAYPDVHEVMAIEQAAQSKLAASQRLAERAARAEQEELQQRWTEALRTEHARATRAAESAFQRESRAAADEARRATEANREAAMRKAEVEARARAEAETSARRAQAVEDARLATERAREEAKRKFEAERGERPGFEIGRTKETYKTEFDAAYTQLNREMPTFRRNPMGERVKGLEGKTNTETLINEMALEQRAAGKLSGYRGKLYGDDGKSPLRPDLMQYLRANFGDDIADRLETLVARRAKAQFALDSVGMRDLISSVRRAKQEAQRPPYPGTPMPEKAAVLARLEGALKEDYYQFVRDTGPKGERLVDMSRNVDSEYARYVSDMRRPLAKLFGEKVEPLQAMNQIAKAAEDGNLTVLRPYMRVMSEKGDPQRGAMTVIAHLTNNANDLQSFVKGYQSIHPDAKAVLFAGERGQAAARSLDRLARVAERLAPFEKASKGGAIDLSNRANIAVGLSAMAHFFPALIMGGGAIAASRFMASPRYAEWIVRTSNARTPKQLELAYGQLATMLGRDTTLDSETKQKVMGAVAELAGGKSAQAGEKPNGPDLFTSLERPPSVDEVKQGIASGQRNFDFDLDQPGAEDAVKAIKAAGGKITAYHVGGGGGRAWGGGAAGEAVNKYDTPEALTQLTEDVKTLVAKGADYIHFDNTHRMSGKRLEAVADAIKAGGAGFVAKNNPDKWNLVMKRRPDLKPAYAVVEDAMHDRDETQAAYDLHSNGVPVYIVGFRKPLNGGNGVSDDYAEAYKKANPWAHVLLMDDEKAFDQRSGGFVGDSKKRPPGMMRLGGPGNMVPGVKSSDPAEETAYDRLEQRTPRPPFNFDNMDIQSGAPAERARDKEFDWRFEVPEEALDMPPAFNEASARGARPPGIMRLGGPKEASDEAGDQVVSQYADLIANAANKGGLDIRSANPQAVIDAAWKQSPTDGMADAIEFIAKRHGLKVPWE